MASSERPLTKRRVVIKHSSVLGLSGGKSMGQVLPESLLEKKMLDGASTDVDIGASADFSAGGGHAGEAVKDVGGENVARKIKEDAREKVKLGKGRYMRRLDLNPLRVEETFVPKWGLKEGPRLIYPLVFTNWLMNIPPPTEMSSIQHFDSDVLHDDIATTLTTLVERKSLKLERAKLEAEAGVASLLQQERDDYNELVKVKGDLIKESDVRVTDLSKKQGNIKGKINQIKQLRADLDMRSQELSGQIVELEEDRERALVLLRVRAVSAVLCVGTLHRVSVAQRTLSGRRGSAQLKNGRRRGSTRLKNGGHGGSARLKNGGRRGRILEDLAVGYVYNLDMLFSTHRFSHLPFISKIVTFPEIRPLVSDEICTVGSLDVGEHFHRRKLRSEVWKYDFTSDQFVTVFLSKTGKLIVLHVGQDEDVGMVDDDDDDEDKPVTMLVIVNGVGFPKLRAGSISWQGEGLPSCRKIDRSEADRAKHWLPLLATRSGYLGCTKALDSGCDSMIIITVVWIDLETSSGNPKGLGMSIGREQAVFKKNDSNQDGTNDESGCLRLRVDTKTSTRRKCEGRLLTRTAKEGGKTTAIATQDSPSEGAKGRAYSSLNLYIVSSKVQQNPPSTSAKVRSAERDAELQRKIIVMIKSMMLEIITGVAKDVNDHLKAVANALRWIKEMETTRDVSGCNE
ncbi:hypothetical protein QVD17_28538 [Tagetes erecta]|uniref:Uncharacterized protein n=1 Tax=Tagetes erecta TaxID=13708 RepID=A0AAD8NSA0_TARER|nr:hypothetical protein QVD17_28538 [Tagetes erecta]